MPQKVLILVESLKVGGGSERFAATLGSRLHEKGHDISYLTLMDENPKYQFKGNYYTLNEGYIYGNLFKRIFDLFRYAPRITKLCRELEIDTIISVSEVANFHAVLSRQLYGNEVRVIASQHINPGIFLKNKLKTSLIRFFYPRADEVVCVSREIEDILNNNYDIHNTRTIYNMMDLKENSKQALKALPPESRELFGDGKQFNFINLGRLARQKGQWFLIRSFRRVLDKYPQARLFILGEGVLRNELEELIEKLSLIEKVHLLGEQENIFPFLKKSDCFILSSLWEGLPLVLIEALSMNLPVISTDCKTGPREILCPDLELGIELEYPCLCKYGALSRGFEDELCLKTLEEEPLNVSEMMLSDLMINFLEDPGLRGRYLNSSELSHKFDEANIIGRWEAIIIND